MQPLATLTLDHIGTLGLIAGWVSHLITALLVTLHCLRNRREATSAILWILLAWSVPVFGPLAFLIVGVNRVPRRAWRKQKADVRLLIERRAREEEAMPLAYWRALRSALVAEPEGTASRKLNKMMNTSLPDFPLLGQNSIEPLLCGDEAFPRMLAAIAGAKDHVHLQTFIIGNDAVGRRMLDALRERAEAGVTVRLLYDRFGSTAAILSGLLRRYAGVPNFKIAGWTLANPVKRQFQINLRNHRKVLIVDGRRAFTGGVNLSANNESVPNRQPDRDYHFELCGPIVQELQYAFLGDWFCMTEEDPDRLLAEAHFPRPEPAGGALVRLINGGPASDTEILTDTFFAMIVQAEKQLYAVTPYFAPPPEIVRALRSAALRGVDVRLVVPEKSNHLYAGWAGRALYEELLDAGVRIFQRPPPFLHAKAMIVDESVALVGTANLDVRSLRLNYETNLAVFDTAFIDVLKRIVLDDVARSRELNLATWRARPTLHRVAENFCSLLTPVL